MTVQLHYCDFCGSKIENDRTHLIVKCGPYRYKTGVGDLDACSSCWAEKIEPQINPTRPATVEHVGGQPEKPRRRLPILTTRNGA